MLQIGDVFDLKETVMEKRRKVKQFKTAEHAKLHNSLSILLSMII